MIIQTLIDRGFVHQMTETKLAEVAATPGALTMYLGIDPTSDSPHLGNMVPMMVLAHFQRAGHNPIGLVGGGTGMIGDPSGKQAERTMMSIEQISANVEGLKKHFARLLRFDGPNAARIVNNADWLCKLNLIDFLRDIGKTTTINVMLARDSVKSRIDREQGLSFTEFSYSLLQGYDWLHMFRELGCNMQIGGSDQWGNIIAGADMIHKIEGTSVHALTVPLLTRSDGSKFGKSEGGALWLDPEKTRPFEMWQYWINTDDRDVERFLKIFTFMPLTDIQTVVDTHMASPHLRHGQRTLAHEVSALLYGEQTAVDLARSAALLYGGDAGSFDAAMLAHLAPALPNAILNADQLATGVPLAQVLVALGFASSNGDARRKIQGGGVAVGDAIAGVDRVLSAEDLSALGAVLVRMGKRQHGIVRKA